MEFSRHKRSLGISAAILVLATVGLFGWRVIVTKRWAESAGCANGMVSICLAARAWSMEHGGSYPTNFMSFADELANPVILHCRADPNPGALGGWSTFKESDSSYEIVNLQMKDGETNKVFLRCKIHGHLGYGDDTVFDGVSRHRKGEFAAR